MKKKGKMKKERDEGIKQSRCDRVREKIQKKKKRKRQEKRLKRAPEPLKIEETWELWK